MPFSGLPPLVATFFSSLAAWIDPRSAARLPLLLCGLLFAKGRPTVTSWFRAAGIAIEFRKACTTVNAVGRDIDVLAFTTLRTVRPLLDRS